MEGIDSRSQTPKKRSYSLFSLVLLVIDAKAGPFDELYDIVEQFRRNLQHNISCKVVWLNDTSARGSKRGDISCSKPLHGSRLNRLLKMLPEFGGTEPKEAPVKLQTDSLIAETSPKHKRCEIQEEGQSSKYNKKLGKSIMAPTPLGRETWLKPVRTDLRTDPMTIGRPEKEPSKPSDDGSLRGKRVLIVDDNTITLSVAARKLGKMGVSIIAVSGHDPDSREAKETIQAGMDAFLEKNLNQNQLANIIREIENKVVV